MSRKLESAIAIILGIAIVVGLFLIVGADNIKYWLSTPITWDEADDIKVSIAYRVTDEDDNSMSDDKVDFVFVVSNYTTKQLGSYEYEINCEGHVFEIYSSKNISAFDCDTKSVTFGTDSGEKVDNATFRKLKYTDLDKINMSYRALKITDSDGEYIVKNTGTVKIIILIISFIVFAILGFSNIVTVAPLRFIFKVLGTPAIVVVFLMMLKVMGGSSTESSAERAKETARKRASETYKREANLKAGALAHGDYAEAAKSQARMDKAMADMIQPGASSSEKTRYKNAASHKAGALAHGNHENAARAQREMDRAMADMLKKQK